METNKNRRGTHHDKEYCDIFRSPLYNSYRQKVVAYLKEHGELSVRELARSVEIDNSLLHRLLLTTDEVYLDDYSSGEEKWGYFPYGEARIGDENMFRSAGGYEITDIRAAQYATARGYI